MSKLIEIALKALVLTVLSSSLAAAQGFAPSGQSAKAPVPQGEPPLYDRLGGITAIQGVVDEFVKNCARDARIKAFFTATAADPKRLLAFKNRLTDQICEAAGGPCTYTGKSMKEAHKNMHISDDHFDALVEDLVKALDHFKVGEIEKNELLAKLAPMRADIVES